MSFFRVFGLFVFIAQKGLFSFQGYVGNTYHQGYVFPRLGNTYHQGYVIPRLGNTYNLQSSFPMLSASFTSTSCCFYSGIPLQIVAFQLEGLFSFTQKKTDRVFCAFSLATSVILLSCAEMYPEQGMIAQMYHDLSTFDLSQGHVTKSRPTAFAVQLSEILGI